MAEISFENIQPLIVEESVSGDSILYVFECPLSGVQVPSQYDFPKDKTAKSGIKKKFFKSILTIFTKGIKTFGKFVFGKSIIGKLVTNVAKTGAKSLGKDAIKTRHFSAKEKRQAGEGAFRAVISQWLWDGFRATWLVRAEAGRFISDFQRQVASAGLAANYDREVAVRMMMEVAQVDDRISAPEEDFLIRFLGAEHNSLPEIQGRPPLTDSELDELEPGPERVTLLMLAWVMSLSDGWLSTPQQQRLQAFGERLSMSTEDISDAATFARRYIVEEVMRGLYADGAYNPDTRAKAYAFAGQVGMVQDDAERTEAKFLKRISYGI